MKTHTKTALVIREEGRRLRRYCHVGTGNYNSDTARLYEDLGLLSADPDLGADLIHLFNHLTGYSREVRYRKLLVAPRWLRPKVQDLILNEAKAGASGRIIIKMNSLVDPAMIDALYTASQAGVEIDLIIRGICCLRPGCAGLVRATSASARSSAATSSTRASTTSRTVRPRASRCTSSARPTSCSATSTAASRPSLRSRLPHCRPGLQEVLDVSLTDDVLAWALDSDGAWTRVETVHHNDAHRRLQELALARARA